MFEHIRRSVVPGPTLFSGHESKSASFMLDKALRLLAASLLLRPLRRSKLLSSPCRQGDIHEGYNLQLASKGLKTVLGDLTADQQNSVRTACRDCN